MSLADVLAARMFHPVRSLATRHGELVKFGVVGALCFVIDTGIFTALKTTLLAPKPVTAKVIATVVATVVSYALNRGWSFRTRGGRRRTHEAALFFLISVLGVGLNSAPLWVSRYVLHLQAPLVSRFVQETADFVSAQLVGTVVAMAFRWWAFRAWVFPHVRPRELPAPVIPESQELGN